MEAFFKQQLEALFFDEPTNVELANDAGVTAKQLGVSDTFAKLLMEARTAYAVELALLFSWPWVETARNAAADFGWRAREDSNADLPLSRVREPKGRRRPARRLNYCSLSFETEYGSPFRFYTTINGLAGEEPYRGWSIQFGLTAPAECELQLDKKLQKYALTEIAIDEKYVEVDWWPSTPKQFVHNYVEAVDLYESFLLALHALLAGYAEDCHLGGA